MTKKVSIIEVRKMLRRGDPYRYISHVSGWTPSQLTAMAAILGIKRKRGPKSKQEAK